MPHISLLIGTNDKLMAAIGKCPSAIGKFMVRKTLSTNGVEITNALMYWQIIGNH